MNRHYSIHRVENSFRDLPSGAPRLNSANHIVSRSPRILPLLAVGLVALFGRSSSSTAANGTWTNPTSGLWSNPGNWSGGTIADGTDGIADFSTLNITADDTVHLDSSRTIGTLKFGDTTPSNNWIIDNNGNSANVLTLATSSGMPLIQVNNTNAIIGVSLGGTQGVAIQRVFPSTGTVFLTATNAFTGPTDISLATVNISSDAALGSVPSVLTTAIDLNDATLQFGTNLALNANRSLVVEGASPDVFDTQSFNVSYGGSISGIGNNAGIQKNGSGTLTLAGTNTNTTGITVAQGTLILGSDSTIGAAGTLLKVDQPGFGNARGTVKFVSDMSLTHVVNIPDSDVGTIDTNGFTINVPNISGQGTLVVASSSPGGGLVLGSAPQLSNAVVNPTATLRFSQGGFGGFISLVDNGTIDLNGLPGQVIDLSQLTGSGVITNTGVTEQAVVVSSRFPMVFSGTIQETSQGQINLLSGGPIYLTGKNTFSGGTTISNQTLDFVDGALGASGSITVSTTATIRPVLQYAPTPAMGGPGNTEDVSSRFIAGPGGTVDTNGNNVVWAGPMTATNWSGAFLKGGPGALTISGANTGLSVPGAGAGSSVTIEGGVLGLDFTNHPGTVNSKLPAGQAVTLLGGALELIGNPTASSSQTFQAKTTGNGVLLSANGVGEIALQNNGADILLSAHGITRNGTVGGTLDLTLPAGAQTSTNGILTTSPNVAFTGGTTPATILSGWETVNHNTWATNSNGNVKGLSAYAAGFTAGADVDVVSDAANGGPSTPGPMTINSLRFNSPGPYTVNPSGNLTVASGGILVTPAVGSGAVTIGAPNTTKALTSGNGTDLIVIQNDALSQTTLNSEVTGAIALTKAGAGALVVANANNAYTGGTYIGGGFDSMDNPIPGVLQVPSDVTAGGMTPTADYLGAAPKSAANNIFLNDGILQFSTSTTIATTRTIVLTGMGGGIDTMNNTVTFAGSIVDTGANGGTAATFTKLGSGTLVLTGGNGFIGTTNIAAGVLSFTGNTSFSSLGSGPITFSGGTLQYGPSTTTDISSRIVFSNSPVVIDLNSNNFIWATGLGPWVRDGLTVGDTGARTGTIVLAGTNTYSGPTTLTRGQLFVSGSLPANGSDSVYVSAGTDFKTASLVRVIQPGGSYAGLGSTAIAGALGVLGTSADIRLGSDNNSSSNNVAMQWRVGNANDSPRLVSDVLNLTGMSSTTGSHVQTDPFVLQMTYNSMALGGNESQLAASGVIDLSWLNTSLNSPNGMWVNATLGNFGSGHSGDIFQNVQSSWDAFAASEGVTPANLPDFLGSYGTDTVHHTVWAVVNHNSQFAVSVVPEPSTLILAMGGILLAAMRVRRHRIGEGLRAAKTARR